MDTSNSTNLPVGHTDIRRGGWIERHLPRAAHPFLYLMRLDRPIGTWLLLLPGWWAICGAARGVRGMGVWDWYVLVLFAVGAVLMRGAGCAINDIWDRDIDAQVERTRSRPLAAGDITLSQAVAFVFLLMWLSLLILVQLPAAAIFIGFASILLVVLYPLAKRVTWYPQFVLGLTFNIGALMGWAAIRSHVEMSAVLLYFAGILWTLGYDTIYAHQDKDDDAVVGVKSTALKFGNQSAQYISAFYAASIVLLHLAGWIMMAGPLFYVIWAVGAFHLIRQAYVLNIDDPALCLRLFRSNRDFGLIIFAAFAFGFLI